MRVYYAQITLCFILLLGLANSCHVGRSLVFLFADMRDYKKFPAHEIEAPETTFTFHQAKDSSLAYHLDTAKLLYRRPYDSFDAFLSENKTLSFLVIQHDSILYEKYYRYAEESSILPTFSMAKSYVSALVGIAIEEGHIESVQDPITKYLDVFEDSSFQNITIEHLLNMQSGIAFSEKYFSPFSDIAKFYYGRKLKKYVSNLEIERPPGEKFKYQSVDTQVLSIILARATGKTVSEYLEEKIWQPLGMEYDASWSIDSKKWNTEKSFCCLNARTRDYARFGRLFLQKGNWNGKQIIPEDWVEKCMSENEVSSKYSYQWWLYHKDDIFYANGLYGQFIYIDPGKNLIIVRMGKRSGDAWWPVVFNKVGSRLNGDSKKN